MRTKEEKYEEKWQKWARHSLAQAKWQLRRLAETRPHTEAKVRELRDELTKLAREVRAL